MDIYSILSLVIGFVGIIGTGISIYQFAILNERKRRDTQLQYLLAGISSIAIYKHQSWSNQIKLLPPSTNASELIALLVYSRARDDWSEMHGLAAALEGVVNERGSASTDLMKRILEQGKLNNEIQNVNSKTEP